MTKTKVEVDSEREVDRAIERAFENLAQDLDAIANKYELNSNQMTGLVTDWDFEDYYADWMREGWE